MAQKGRRKNLHEEELKIDDPTRSWIRLSVTFNFALRCFACGTLLNGKRGAEAIKIVLSKTNKVINIAHMNFITAAASIYAWNPSTWFSLCLIMSGDIKIFKRPGTRYLSWCLQVWPLGTVKVENILLIEVENLATKWKADDESTTLKPQLNPSSHVRIHKSQCSNRYKVLYHTISDWSVLVHKPLNVNSVVTAGNNRR